MLIGAHLLLYSADADADRAFFRDVLEFPHVDAGHGWLIFRLPSAEAALHPAPAGAQIQHGGTMMAESALYLMCTDLDGTMQTFAGRGVRFAEVTTERWGRKTAMTLPSGAAIGLYEPSHPLAIDVK